MSSHVEPREQRRTRALAFGCSGFAPRDNNGDGVVRARTRMALRTCWPNSDDRARADLTVVEAEPSSLVRSGHRGAT